MKGNEKASVIRKWKVQGGRKKSKCVAALT